MPGAVRGDLFIALRAGCRPVNEIDGDPGGKHDLWRHWTRVAIRKEAQKGEEALLHSLPQVWLSLELPAVMRLRRNAAQSVS